MILPYFNILVFSDEVQLHRKAFSRRDGLYDPMELHTIFFALYVIDRLMSVRPVSFCIDLEIIGRLYGATILLARFRAMLRLLVLMVEPNYYKSMDVVSTW